jgi:hypothetical protein
MCELAMSTIVILVVLLVLMSILLILLSGNGSRFSDFGGEKIADGSDTTECEMICYNCCRSDRLDCGLTAPQTIKKCNCIDEKPIEEGC